MAKAVIMPKFGFTQETAVIVRWMAREGDQVEAGDPLCEVTTDKIDMEVEAPAGGTLGGLRFPEGAEVPVTEVIAYLLAPGERLPEGESAPQPDVPAASVPEAAASEPAFAPGSRPEPGAAVPATPLARRIAAVEGVDLTALVGSGQGGRVTRKDVAGYLHSAGQAQPPAAAPGKVRATPAARRLARQEGVDLSRVTGTDFEGRIQGSDIAHFVAQHERSQEAAAPVPSVQSIRPQAVPLEGMRRTIARRMQASAQQAPHIYLSLDIDMSRAERMRAAFNARLPDGQPPVSMTAVILKAAAAALVENPRMNSYFQDDQILLIPEIHVGMAVALEDGLIVPVLRNADVKPLAQLAAEAADLARRAREGKLRPEEVMDGTFTVSNLGMLGVDHFTAIINPPQVAILAVGRIARRFVPGEDDLPVARSLMTVTLSCDHRAVDGAAGARFLGALKDILETAGAQWG